MNRFIREIRKRGLWLTARQAKQMNNILSLTRVYAAIGLSPADEEFIHEFQQRVKEMRS
jgi:hypothetical protein